MRKFAIIPNTERDICFQETKNVIEYLRKKECIIYMEEIHQDNEFDDVEYVGLEEAISKSDFVVALGGDGTILNVDPIAAKHNTPILGINLGNLGFLAQIEKGDYQAFEHIFNGNYSLRNCMMLNCAVMRENKELDRFIALNDIVVSGDGYSRMIRVSAAVNGTSIGEYSADGLILATAVGSTAYSLSAGGAVMHPEMEAIMITPICPHTLTARTMIVPDKDTIEVKPVLPCRSAVVVMADGKRRHDLKENERILVTRSEYVTKLVVVDNRNFFDVLREKLSD